MTDQSFDVVVIGAGPAGSAAARRACDLGLSVALIDKAVFPRPKLCGALVSPRGNKAVRRVFDMEMTPEMYLVSRQVAFKWDGEELNRFDAPYDLTYTYRLDFDHWLQRAAVAAGAVDMQGTRVERILDGESAIVLADGTRIGYGVLVGADGAASPVAKHILGAAFDPEKIGFAFETEVPGGCEAEALMSIDFDIVRWGYGWNFPKAGSRTIGLGAIRSVDQDLKALMARYLAHEGVDAASVTIKGAHIPLGDFKEHPGKGNILLVGDAAGFVDGITGEGIALAIESGAEAAEAAAQVIAEGRVQRADRAYVRRIRYIQSDLERVRRLRVIAYKSAMRDLFREKLRTSDLMRSSLFEVLAGEATYADIEKKVAKRAFMSVARGLSSWPSKLSRRAG
ncbi:geranylgeranyl reductase family protein [Maritimibacter sp. UBA3975]|uniref:geranylgeranyl reductase family protein n=1 Tax=Maritimibacter sp. UBA3975 TaxID=1946833 RepID=UPI0025BF37B9|nr:geranylgeranyl reductase family protein [Maritimibacter sp. UBA3975]